MIRRDGVIRGDFDPVGLLDLLADLTDPTSPQERKARERDRAAEEAAHA